MFLLPVSDKPAPNYNVHGRDYVPALPGRLRPKPIQGRPVDSEGAGNIHNGVTGVRSLDRLPSLMRGSRVLTRACPRSVSLLFCSTIYATINGRIFRFK
jgi:hypothetical protein